MVSKVTVKWRTSPSADVSTGHEDTQTSDGRPKAPCILNLDTGWECIQAPAASSPIPTE